MFALECASDSFHSTKNAIPVFAESLSTIVDFNKVFIDELTMGTPTSCIASDLVNITASRFLDAATKLLPVKAFESRLLSSETSLHADIVAIETIRQTTECTSGSVASY